MRMRVLTTDNAWTNSGVEKNSNESCSDDEIKERSYLESWKHYFLSTTKLPSITQVLWTLGWGFCICASLVFVRSTCLEYQESSPITTFTFIDQPEQPDPVIIKICNSVFLDAEKIASYNATEFSYDSYEFLDQAVSGNYTFDDSNWVVSTSVNDVFFLSARIMEKFKLDVDRFIGSCYVVGNYKDCIPDFKLHLDGDMVCYQAEIDLGGYGGNRAVKIGFFFDPDIELGKYIAQKGAYVTFHHPTDYMPYSDGFFLEPKHFVTVSAVTEHKTQKISYDKAKCTKPGGPQFYNFTGEPFEVTYKADYCEKLCIAEAYYEECSCAPFVGMNLTNTQCLEKLDRRLCLKTLGAFPENVESRSKKCLSKCLGKCSQTYLKTTVFRQRNKYTKYKMKTVLEDLSLRYNYKSTISTMLLNRINNSDDPLGEADVIKEGPTIFSSDYLDYTEVSLKIVNFFCF